MQYIQTNTLDRLGPFCDAEHEAIYTAENSKDCKRTHYVTNITPHSATSLASAINDLFLFCLENCQLRAFFKFIQQVW